MNNEPYFAAVATSDARPHRTITQLIEDGEYFAVQDPRHVSIVEIYEDTDMNAALTDLTLAVLAPNGDVERHDHFYDCREGWTVVGHLPIESTFGPQQAFVVMAVREAEASLVDDQEGPVNTAYQGAWNAIHENRRAELDKARRGLTGALYAANIDSGWWTTWAFSCVYGDDIAALAARDLIKEGTDWDQAAYDLLTGPWLAAFKRPLHPGDALVVA